MRFFEDLRYAVRQLTHARGFTAVAVLTLALGIAGSTMFFAAVNAMVFRPIRATRTDGLFVVRYIHKLKAHGPLTEQQFKRLEADPPPAVGRIGAIAGMAEPVVVAVAAIGERYLQSQRVGFMPNEILTWVAVLVLILAFGIGAALRPAIRAGGVDPNVALREL